MIDPEKARVWVWLSAKVLWKLMVAKFGRKVQAKTLAQPSPSAYLYKLFFNLFEKVAFYFDEFEIIYHKQAQFFLEGCLSKGDLSNCG